MSYDKGGAENFYEMKGKHILAIGEFTISCYENTDFLLNVLRSCCNEAKANILKEAVAYGHGGAYYSILISESHLNLIPHILKDKTLLLFDFFTCGKNTDVVAGYESFKEKLNGCYVELLKQIYSKHESGVVREVKKGEIILDTKYLMGCVGIDDVLNLEKNYLYNKTNTIIDLKHIFDNGGISKVMICAVENNVMSYALHTYPERWKAFIDIFNPVLAKQNESDAKYLWKKEVEL